MRILVVEDKKALSAVISERLESEGYVVDAAFDGEEGLYAASTGAFDLVILDVMLPGIDGFEILNELQKQKVESKIIILSAKSSLNDKLQGLKNGADDYVVKPFHLDELIARVDLQLKTKTNSVNGHLVYEDLELDTKKCILICRKTKQPVELVKKELEILEFFIKNKEQVLSRQQIYDKVWGIDSENESNNLEVYFTFIRRKLRAIGSATTIKAARGLGYKLEYKNEKAKT